MPQESVVINPEDRKTTISPNVSPPYSGRCEDMMADMA